MDIAGSTGGTAALGFALAVSATVLYRSLKTATAASEPSEPSGAGAVGQGRREALKRGSASVEEEAVEILVLCGSTTGTARRLAEKAAREASSLRALGMRVSASVVDMQDYDSVEALANARFCILLCSTWTGGTAPEGAAFFHRSLCDLSTDFRMPKNAFSRTHFAVFGLGSSLYPEASFCRPARELHSAMAALGGKEMAPTGLGDEQGDIEGEFRAFLDRVWESVQGAAGRGRRRAKRIHGRLPLKEYRRRKREQRQKDEERREREERRSREEEAAEYNSEDELNDKFVNADISEGLADLEDLGSVVAAKGAQRARREMVTPLQRRSLKKEGYKIIGSHSAVKLCRWTKHQLRGRGGCYKHTMYGITSYQCMEATPSLACANKCTFCWRHHKNPVGREWRWTTDAPDMIVSTAISLHQSMIKEMRGVPGVVPERLAEAFNVRHCALSLVGEPIMYPRINELLGELHKRRISSFLVTNAQFPDAMEALGPVTQLYVSIDAATKEALREVDRPLFPDFWERFTRCLALLRVKRTRTVFRLTLVKEYNMQDVAEYAALVEMGEPDLIEIKAVTYCGKSEGSGLQFDNIPWHEEVVRFAADISRRTGGQYEIASEHKHSCCVLLARQKFKVDGAWHTWIDYPRFFELLERYEATGEDFGAEDYMARTPSWAVFGSDERGFSPNENRWYRNRTRRAMESAAAAADDN